MSLDLEPRSRPLPDLDVEQEVDFGRYVRIIAMRWWLLVAGAILGALVGLGVAAGKSRPYEATAIIYLGQPYLPGSAGTPIQSLNTKFSFVKELVTERAILADASAKTGLRPGVLASRISIEPVTGLSRGKFDQPAPLIALTVDRLQARKAAAAANALAGILERYFSSYVDQKMSTYQKRLARIDRRLAVAGANIQSALEQEKALTANHSLPPTEKLLLLAHFDNVLQYNTSIQNQLEADQLSSGDVITLAQQVEKARVLEPARVHRVSPPSRRTSVLIGGFIGLLVGLLAALLWEPVRSRLRSRPDAT